MATNRLYTSMRILLAMLMALLCTSSEAQNDNCSGAIPIFLPNAGYGYGTVSSATTNFSGLSMQPGESLAPANNAAGQNQQSAWYTFTLPTSRYITLSLLQPGSSMNQGDVGLAVYKTPNCLPVPVDLSTQLFPLTGFGSVSAACVAPGTYLVQVVGKSSANGPVFLQLQAAATGAAYDAAADAADLGLAGPLPSSVRYPVDCQSLESPFEVCGSLANASQYSKSSWQVFSTPDVFTSLLFSVSVPSLPAGQKIGLRLFDGDLRWAAGNITVLCDSLVTDASGQAARLFTCGSLRANRVYSAELFFYNDFNAPVEVSVSTDAQVIQNSFKTICSGNSFVLPWGSLATADSTYSDTLRTVGGCDSLIRNVTVQFDTARTTIDTTIYQCPIQNYSLPWGQMVNAPGVYTHTLYYTSGCDSVYQTVRLQLPTVPTLTNAVNACPGTAYTLPWGQMVTMPGRYSDTLKKITGCDSLVHTIDLSFNNNSEIKSLQDSVCGTSYILPWGGIVTSSGTYYDTIRRANGCDSIVTILNLKLKPTLVQKDTVSLCGGSTYTLPWGAVADTTGTYNDIIHYAGMLRCDSLVRQVTLLFNQPIVLPAQVAYLCAGGSYTLPWGTVVNSPGQYKDTIKAASGCDSLTRQVDLLLQTPAVSDTSIQLCEGATYPLPWGGLADRDSVYAHNTPGISGCDSLRQTIRVRVLRSSADTLYLNFCQGQLYTLPWGQVTGSAGTYRDTLRYPSGCDSLLRIVYLSASNYQVKDSIVGLCPGGAFTLPWGPVVNTPGTYIDTLRSFIGCDSLVRRFTITLKTLVIDQKNYSSCTGSYTLPWGQVATSPGIYRDTLQSVAGCDSLVQEINLSLVSTGFQYTDTTICQGQVYLLPNGSTTSVAGMYRDTIRAAGGCDSIIQVTNLTVLTTIKDTIPAFLCEGNSYTLPWGVVVTVSGNYSDTIRGTRGCDSLVHTVMLQLSATKYRYDTLSICNGASYILPWGKPVQSPGSYADTLHNVNGCDSSIHTVWVNVLTTAVKSSSAGFCKGASYTLPWGVTVTTPGIYRDTLRYSTGCDSLVQEVSLFQNQPLLVQVDTSLCNGQAYLLPNGQMATVSGIYRDTVRSITGCDSLVHLTNVSIHSVQTTVMNIVACSGFPFQLPWGEQVINPGTYTDTIRSAKGCDSLVRIVNLSGDSLATSVQKSNDISCLQPSAQLRASGGVSYAWSPPDGLNDLRLYNPVANPAATTTYQVQITKANGCIVTNTITVFVGTGNLDNAFLVPNAFTPDGDGKNDSFGIRHWGAVSNVHFSIYNRWGVMVFQTSDPQRCWDGTYKGALLPTASFVYFIEATTPCGQVFRKGTMTLVR
jgi:gliding motility-associated-like protein